MKIQILKLRLKNFKGIKDLEINFGGKNTNICGANATGKTTIFDAFKWLFFNKDSTERTKFEIKTLDKNNEPIHHLEHEVMAVLSIDGQEMSFKKMLKEKWVRKRGSEFEEYAGTDESSYWIDDVPMKQKDYNDRINEIIPETQFKLITDPLYFNTALSDDEKRKYLLQIAEIEITDEEILEQKSQFEILKNNLNGRTVSDYEKVLKEKISELNKQKETIPIRIDELTTTLITEHEIDYEEIEKEKTIKELELEQVETNMSDVQRRINHNMEIVSKLTVAKKELTDIELKKHIEIKQKRTQDMAELQNQLKQIDNELKQKELDETNAEYEIAKHNRRKEELYRKWDEVSKSQLVFDPNSFICPTCKREYDTDKIDEMKKEFQNNFDTHKQNEKSSINREGQEINEKISNITALKDSLMKEISKLEDKRKEVSQEIEERRSELDKTSFDINSFPEYIEKNKEVEQLEKEVNSLQKESIDEFQKEKSSITEEINKLNKILNDKETQLKTKTRISELEEEERTIANKIQELESQQYQVEEFTRTKTKIIEEKVNDKFEFVKFRLFEKQKNGGIRECCDALVSGVPYSDVNSAHKILAGLDIINTLIKFYNISAPIFIDNRESINDLCNINAQIVNLIVTTDSKLRIEMN